MLGSIVLLFIRWSAFGIVHCLLIILVAVSLFSSNALAELAYGDAVSSLKGIESFKVVVLINEKEIAAEKAGCTERDLKTVIELELRKAGITVDDKSLVSLDLQFSIMQSNSKDFFVYSYILSVRQPGVFFASNFEEIVAGITWGPNSSLGYAGTRRVPAIREDFKGLLNAFMNDYL